MSLTIFLRQGQIICGEFMVSFHFHSHQYALAKLLILWRATADEDGHYCFAVAL